MKSIKTRQGIGGGGMDLGELAKLGSKAVATRRKRREKAERMIKKLVLKT